MGKGLVVILSGACSVGKHDISNRLINDSDLKLMDSISMTTRPKRDSEVDGKDYYFVDFKTFANAVKEGDLLEYTEFNGWYYGTPRNQVEFLVNSGKNVLVTVEAQGAGNIRLEMPDSVAIFITPSSIEELEANINALYSDDQASAQRRINKAKMEMEIAPLFDNVVATNEDSEVVYANVKKIIVDTLAKRGE